MLVNVSLPPERFYRILRIKGFPVLRFFQLRATTWVRISAGRLGLARAPQKLIFMHIPKTAGTTAKDYVMACVGSRKSGHSVALTDCFERDYVSEQLLEKARKARFVSGHYSWSTKTKLGELEGVSFTTLCDPAERLWSLHHTFRKTAWRNTREYMDDVYAWSVKLPAAEFYAIDDVRIRQLADNVMVRQIGSSHYPIPDTDKDWAALLEQAKTNLQKFDHVCFKDSFDRDFVQVLQSANLPVLPNIGKRNVSNGDGLEQGGQKCVRRKFVTEAADMIEPFIRWDRQLYEYALNLRASGKL